MLALLGPGVALVYPGTRTASSAAMLLVTVL